MSTHRLARKNIKEWRKWCAMTRFLWNNSLIEISLMFWNEDLIKRRVLTAYCLAFEFPSLECSHSYRILKTNNNNNKKEVVNILSTDLETGWYWTLPDFTYEMILHVCTLFCWYYNCWFGFFCWLFFNTIISISTFIQRSVQEYTHSVRN